ncbi:MAG: GntR family transcriptional regulator [Pseudomonadota bacterium]
MSISTDVPVSGPPKGSLVDWLTDVLKQRIAEGRYGPGEWIREQALQKEFGLSNGPVREALERLVGAGVFVREARRGVRIVNLTEQEVVELFELRIGVLEMAAELAARQSNSTLAEDCNSLFREIDKSVAQNKSEDVSKLLADVAAKVFWASDNQQIFKNWNDLNLKIRIYAYAAFRNSKNPDEIIDMWRRLIDAIVDGDIRSSKTTIRGIYKMMLMALGLEKRSSLFSRRNATQAAR